MHTPPLVSSRYCCALTKPLRSAVEANDRSHPHWMKTAFSMPTKAVTASHGTVTPCIGVRSSCGNQVRSTRVSNPSFGFGTSDREGQAKRYISNMHVYKDNVQALAVPGPGSYSHRAVTGKVQSSSAIKNVARYGFGTQSRMDDKEMRRTAAIPGPGAYTPA